jgi:hypothetical protein
MRFRAAVVAGGCSPMCRLAGLRYDNDDLPFQDKLSLAAIKFTQVGANTWRVTLREGAPSWVTQGNAVRRLGENDRVEHGNHAPTL